MPEAVEPKKFSPAIIIVSIVLVAAGALRLYDAWKSRRVILAEASVNGKTFTVEVADTEAKKEKGLGDRDGLPEGRGMYFPFGAEQYWIFWMKDMRFPIDIIWLREGKIVDIEADVPVSRNEPLETYSPIEPADAVLELNAGDAERLGLKAGDILTLRAL